MKKVLNILLVAVMLVSIAGTASAQTKAKKGYINSNELLLAMPERAQAEKAIQEEAQRLEAQLTAMSNEYQAKVGEYQAQAGTMSQIIRETKAREISDLEVRIQNFQMSAQESLQVKEGELVQPLIDKAKKVIEEVAKENGYTEVVDLSTGVFIVYPKENDLMELVKKKMGIAAQ